MPKWLPKYSENAALGALGADFRDFWASRKCAVFWSHPKSEKTPLVPAIGRPFPAIGMPGLPPLPQALLPVYIYTRTRARYARARSIQPPINLHLVVNSKDLRQNVNWLVAGLNDWARSGVARASCSICLIARQGRRLGTPMVAPAPLVPSGFISGGLDTTKITYSCWLQLSASYSINFICF